MEHDVSGPPQKSDAALRRPESLQDFAGVWRLERRIEDQRAGQVAHATGQAMLSAEGAGLIYEETVLLHLPGQAPLEGRRRYLWRAAARGIAVLFDDGRDFHVIPLGNGAPEAAHWCDPDQYDVRYDFSAWPQWSSVWDVCGPRKDYRMETGYERLPEA